jgi:cytochrome bd-type quinol oxidase subunit 2
VAACAAITVLLQILLGGVCLAIPMILGYSAYSYYVFRGPVTTGDPDPVNYLKELRTDADK